MFKKAWEGLTKTKDLFVSNLKTVFAVDSSAPKKSTQEILQELEEALLQSDVGVRTSHHLVAQVKRRLESAASKENFDLRQVLRAEMIATLEVNQKRLDLRLQSRARPTVLLICGVNGTGKTTSVAKIAHFYKNTADESLRRSNIVVAAADQTRAAAVDQLRTWGERVGVPVVVRRPSTTIDEEKLTADTVVYEAIQHSVQRMKDAAPDSKQDDLVIVDTAGRLQNNAPLMRELQQIYDAASKARKGAPDHVWLVVDATIGQSSIEQARAFHQKVRVNALVVTKLDGSAKGGVVLGIAHELRLPVAFCGVGEGVDDLKPFDATAFVDSILGEPADESKAEGDDKEKQELVIEV